MLKTPEQVLEEAKKWFEETKIKWNKKSYLLTLREEGDSQVTEQIKEILIWIDEALEKNRIEGWKEFYTKWNGDSDTSKDKYDGDKDLIGRLSDLRLFLVEWERVSREQSQQELIQKLRNALQEVGIDPDGENIDEKVEELKKVQTDLTALKIDKSKVKEAIESERMGSAQIRYWLKIYFGEEYETKIEMK